MSLEIRRRRGGSTITINPGSLRVCAGDLDRNYLKKTYVWLSGTSTERFSKSERNWIQAWECAILKEMGKNLNVKVWAWACSLNTSVPATAMIIPQWAQ